MPVGTIADLMSEYLIAMRDGRAPRSFPALVAIFSGDKPSVKRPPWYTQVVRVAPKEPMIEEPGVEFRDVLEQSDEINRRANAASRRREIVPQFFAQIDIRCQVHRLVKSKRNRSPSICIGRAKRNDIQLWDSSASSRHATIKCVDDAFYLSDQKSANGTRVDRRRLESRESVELKSGMYVAFGMSGFWYLDSADLLQLIDERLQELLQKAQGRLDDRAREIRDMANKLRGARAKPDATED